MPPVFCTIRILAGFRKQDMPVCAIAIDKLGFLNRGLTWLVFTARVCFISHFCMFISCPSSFLSCRCKSRPFHFFYFSQCYVLYFLSFSSTMLMFIFVSFFLFISSSQVFFSIPHIPSFDPRHCFLPHSPSSYAFLSP